MDASEIPVQFDNILGQQRSIELLLRAYHKKRLAPGYLFVGPDGIGRSLVAAAFAALLLGNGQSQRRRVASRNHPDLLWVEPTYLHQGKRLTVAEAAAAGLKRRGLPQVRLDQIRDIAQFLSRPPLEAERTVVVIEAAERIAEAAANGLLKTLEEPGRATLILIAPDQHSLLPTLISRCHAVPFRRLSSADLTQVLTQLGHQALLEHPDLLALAQGSPGAAIAAWQQFQTIPPELLEKIRQPILEVRTALELGRQIAQSLEPDSQLWLIDYLQQLRWRQGLVAGLQELEQARQQLLQYVQPRLVWEVVCLALVISAPGAIVGAGPSHLPE